MKQGESSTKIKWICRNLVVVVFYYLIILKRSQYCPKPYETIGGDINVKVDLSNYTTKTDLKNPTGTDSSKLAAKSDLVRLKAELYKLDIDKLKSTPINLSNLKSKADKLDIEKIKTTLVDLSKLSNIVKNDVVKKTEYNAKIKNIEGKIPDIANLATKNTLNAEMNGAKAGIPSINNLATTTAALIAVEKKKPDVSNLVLKTDYNTKVNETEKKLLVIVMKNILLLQNLIS